MANVNPKEKIPGLRDNKNICLIQWKEVGDKLLKKQSSYFK